MYEIVKSSRFKDATLENFYLPEAELTKILDWVAKPRNFLIFNGNPGIGKTHFCVALAKKLQNSAKSDPMQFAFKYFHERDFFSQLRCNMKNAGDYESMISRLCEENNILIFDDFGSSLMTDWQKESLFSFIDHRYYSEKPTVLTSNHFLSQMNEIFHPRLVSRLEDKKNVIVEINWIDKRKKEAE